MVPLSSAAAVSSLRAERGRAFFYTRGLRPQAAAPLVDPACPLVALRTADRWEGGGPASAGGTDWGRSRPAPAEGSAAGGPAAPGEWGLASRSLRAAALRRTRALAPLLTQTQD